jgi:hypothetical protein
MVLVKYEDLTMAFDFVSSGAPMENEAYISLDTGAVSWSVDSDSGDDQVPEDLGESERYLEIPHKNDLDLGKNLVFRFIAAEMPSLFARVEGIFRRKGAYSRFKELLSAEGLLEDWYAFEAAETDAALRAWCRENDIRIIEEGPEPTA